MAVMGARGDAPARSAPCTTSASRSARPRSSASWVPTASGKSTTIRLLLGYLHPSAGRASVLGRDVATHSEDIRRHTGYLPGGIAFYDSMTGEEQLRYLSALDDRPAPLRAELVERMELSARDLRRQIRDYSRGMRQKVGIIQAFQHDPELAILDEPTEGLDPLMQRSFYEILEDRRRAGRTIFFSSHILSEVERVCDRVAIVRQGELVALERRGRAAAASSPARRDPFRRCASTIWSPCPASARSRCARAC